MSTNDIPERLGWIDLEMTGLNPERDSIIEIAVVVSDVNLNIIAQGPNIAISTSAEQLSVMDDWNQKTHGASGLLARVRASTISLAAAEQQTLEFLHQHLKAGNSPLCGNSVHQDRRFLAKYMPGLEAFFHYRNLDVSSLKILAQIWSDLPEYDKDSDHTALADIYASIEELKHWRQHILSI